MNTDLGKVTNFDLSAFNYKEKGMTGWGDSIQLYLNLKSLGYIGHTVQCSLCKVKDAASNAIYPRQGPPRGGGAFRASRTYGWIMDKTDLLF